MTFPGKLALAIGAAALALSGVAPAQAQVQAPAPAPASNANQIIRSIGIADLQQFVLLRGDSVVQAGRAPSISLLARTKGGINYWLVGQACNQRGVIGCEGLFLQVLYTMDAGVTDATLSNANDAYAALKIFKDQPNKSVIVSRYLVLRGGVTRQNVVENITVLVGLAPPASRIAAGKAPPAPSAPKPK